MGFLLRPVLPVDQTLGRFKNKLRGQMGFSQAALEPAGHWGLAQDPQNHGQLSQDQEKEMEQLLSIGYLSGSKPGPDLSGITSMDATEASGNLRYFTSGHAPCAELMDPAGRILHRWQYSYDQCRQDGAEAGLIFPVDTKSVTDCWRRAHLLPGGEILAIFEGHGLVKIDRDSRWIWGFPDRCHHDLELAPDGSIFVLTRDAAILPRIHPDKPVLLDFIVHLSPEGKVIDTIDLLVAIENSVYASMLDFAKEAGDIFHTNTLELLDGKNAHRSPVFSEGNFLISIRELNTIAIVDPKLKQVVWALSGMWVAQHQPVLLDNGNILLFDNLGHRGRSKVVEFDPLTQEVAWTYADGPNGSLYSKTCGSCQRLPSGNTLITESDNGRVIEVTPTGQIVWEHRNPRRTGQNKELIAATLEMVILPEDYSADWLSAIP
ncbi:MAG: arylsulfotransferase family protein [Gemmatimonadales bacterium]|nr:arylsulfotransferase family protein [Gemmatimonadales bacterium]